MATYMSHETLFLMLLLLKSFMLANEQESEEQGTEIRGKEIS
ncbi:hypothetical protein COLO4_34375 [Corchorus olitorius]|uniref:Uncharacterized protein n=1 Tax=Corchorus olitorius TaxID=93759 RepID=A0A1R3GL82_9ROSI|nr:hypothetical protein COLO4_34375 [Corchorus olitorius]